MRESWILEETLKTKLEAIKNGIQLIWSLYIIWFSYYLIFIWSYQYLFIFHIFFLFIIIKVEGYALVCLEAYASPQLGKTSQEVFSNIVADWMNISNVFDVITLMENTHLIRQS